MINLMPFELEGSMALDFLMKSFYYKIFLSYFIFERINILKIKIESQKEKLK